MKISGPFLKWSAIALGVVGGVLFVFGNAFFTSGSRVGVAVVGVGMVANGALGITTKRISFGRRGGRENYEGSDAVILGVTSAVFGVALTSWALFVWAP